MITDYAIVSLLPNPHLATELPADFAWTDDVAKVLEEFKQGQSYEWPSLSDAGRDILAPLRRAHLACAHLPGDYDSLNHDAQFYARRSVFKSWYDDRPNVLVSDIDNLIAALYLWVEHYIKGFRGNAGVYYFRDGLHKYQMVRMALSPAKVPTEPAKTLFTAPRGSQKTMTIIQHAATMMPCVRPYTEILINEFNQQRCDEEALKVQNQFQDNTLIHADFGDPGTLFPMNKNPGKKWSTHQLDFLHLPGCRIIFRPFRSGARGSHPKWWVLDDVEDPKKRPTLEIKRDTFSMIFQRGMPMLTAGNVCTWMTTRIIGSCSDTMMRGSVSDEEKDALADALRDNRPEDWTRENIDLLTEREDGTVYSIYPDYISVEGYYKKERALGKREAMAEYRGIATADGDFVLLRDEIKHGYMKYTEFAGIPGKARTMFWDLKTGKRMPWADFLQRLFRVSALDFANSMRKDADYGCNVTLGVDPNRTIYVLDCMMKRIPADRWVKEAFMAVGVWKTEKMGMEAAAMQDVFVRQARRIAHAMREKGFDLPLPVAIRNPQTDKSRRILAVLGPLYRCEEIRFPCLIPMPGDDGEIIQPDPLESRLSFRLLFDQLDTYTTEGPSGADDGPDALHMAIKCAGKRTGTEPVEEDPDELELREWMKLGVDFRQQIPPNRWTPSMRADFRKQQSPARAMQIVDPYG